MGAININDMRSRIRGLDANETIIQERVLNNIKTHYSSKQIFSFMEECITNSSSPNLLICMEIFDIFAEKSNISNINKLGNLIINEAVNKSRDAKETAKIIKMRMSRATNKSALKISHNIQDQINDAIKKSFNATGSNVAKVDSSTPAETTDDSLKENAINLIYNKILDKLYLCEYCDLIIENYNRVSKRFNIDNLFSSNPSINGIQDTVIELCNFIDTYNIPDIIKYNTIIETAWYGLEKYSTSYKISDIINTANDYFLFKEDGINTCKNVLESTILFDKDDLKDVDILTEEEPESDNLDNSSYISKKIDNYTEGASDNNTSENKEESKDEEIDFDKLFNEYKKSELSKDANTKPEGKLRKMIRKLYSNNVTNITKGTPKFLSFIRGFFILGIAAIPAVGPIISIGTLIADRAISMKIKKQDAIKMIDCFNNEIKNTKTKIASTSDEETKKKLEAYIKSLNNAKSKLNEYLGDVSTEKEQEDRYNKEIEDGVYDSDSSDDDFNFDGFDFNFDEALNKIYDNLIYISDNSIISNNIPDNINEFKDIDIDSVKLYTLAECINYTDAVCNYYKAMNDYTINAKSSYPLNEVSFLNNLKLAGQKLKNSLTNLNDKQKQISKNVDYSMSNLTKNFEKSFTNDNREAIIKGSILPSASKIIKLGILNAGLIAIGQPVLAVISTLGYFGISAKYKAKERQMIIDDIEIELEMCKKYIEIAESKNDMKALKQLLTIQRNLQRQLQRIKYKMKVELGQKVYDTKGVE